MILINKYQYIPIFNEVLSKKLHSNEYILKLLDRVRDNIYNKTPDIKTNTHLFDQLILLGYKGLGIKDTDNLHDVIFGIENVAATGDIAEMMEYRISNPLRPTQTIGNLMDLVRQLDHSGFQTEETEDIYKLILATAMVSFYG